MECVNQFQVDAESHGVVVEILLVATDALQGAGILSVVTVDKAHILSFVEFGIASRAFLLHGFFKTESVLKWLEYSGMALGLFCRFEMLHHELQRNVF